VAGTWSTDDVARLLKYLGSELRPSKKEDVYQMPGRPAIPVPRNRAAVQKGTFGSICRLAGITVQEAETIRRAKFK
jgi:hypothetical protein